MNILYVTGACLDKNTSANMSHNGYIKGLLDNGANVEIIMANDSYGKLDNKLKRFDCAKYYTYNSISFSEKLLRYYRNKYTRQKVIKKNINEVDVVNNKQKNRENIRKIVKKVFYTIFKQDSIYPLDSIWLKNASKFKSSIHYDLVISNSSPAASHKLIIILKNNKHIKFNRWVQIWEDPWFHDLYGGHHELIRQEEHLLLREAQEIYYVSPLTTHYQKKFFADCANKMKCIPLPFLDFASNNIKTNYESELSFGYFGDYYSHTRNLLPFYDAVKLTNSKCFIFGDSDLKLLGNENIIISERVTLDVLDDIQSKTSILVHLCNLKGGQIPGKIYHYSASNKPILFILDGTKFEREYLKDYFSKYNRYYFCNNNINDIVAAITEITKNYSIFCGNIVNEFSPINVVSNILKSE